MIHDCERPCPVAERLDSLQFLVRPEPQLSEASGLFQLLSRPIRLSWRIFFPMFQGHHPIEQPILFPYPHSGVSL